MILPIGAANFHEAMRMGSEVYHHLKSVIKGKYGQDAPKSEHGLIPRVCQELFEKLAERRAYEAKKSDPSKRWELTVTVNFIEIYLDKVRDLLDRDLMTKGKVRTGHVVFSHQRIAIA